MAKTNNQDPPRLDADSPNGPSFGVGAARPCFSVPATLPGQFSTRMHKQRVPVLWRRWSQFYAPPHRRHRRHRTEGVPHLLEDVPPRPRAPEQEAPLLRQVRLGHSGAVRQQLGGFRCSGRVTGRVAGRISHTETRVEVLHPYCKQSCVRNWEDWEGKKKLKL